MDYLEAVMAAGTRQLQQAELEELNRSELGLDSLLGLVYSYADPTEVRAYLEVNSRHLQYAGSVNGGVFCAIAESVASVASMISAQRPCVGVNNSTDFIRGVSEGRIEAIAKPIQNGKRTQLWNVEMYNHEKLVARTTLRTMVVGPPIVELRTQTDQQ
ncbi:PaaI family thioesterase [Corynebacterium pseudodiphtheriticum]|uniref:PaaI family thioesterase n=1 Tax=Corynebacterium pseudodiphtheriticum TaxID=37637 RepID=UPI0025434136|nr:PaaI family thioesterase [Corynebacterium pseudodiphtheriticum]MDK4241431.1 PaaI family thioesterase [Corynebacterium pseudodiphtheriticum]